MGFATTRLARAIPLNMIYLCIVMLLLVCPGETVGAADQNNASALGHINLKGVLDVGFSRRWHHRLGLDARNSIDSGQSTGTRVSFSGEETLGNGYRAFWTAEAGLAIDTGAHSDPMERFLNEQVFLGVTHGAHTWRVGRITPPRHEFLRAIEPFNSGTVGSYRNLYHDQGKNYDFADIGRIDNTVAWHVTLPTGWQMTAAWSANTQGTNPMLDRERQEHAGNNGDRRVLALLPRYTNGGLDIGLSWQALRGRGKDDLDNRQWTLGGVYDFSQAGMLPLRLMGYHDRFVARHGSTSDALGLTRGGRNLVLKNYLIGASAPLGRHTFKLSWAWSVAKQDGEEGRARQWAIGYNYALSRRAALYASHARIKNDARRSASVGDSHHPAGPGVNGYQSGFQTGLRMAF
jgi:predicted porin